MGVFAIFSEFNYQADLIAKQLRECRQLRGEGVRSVADALDVGRSTVSEVESGVSRLLVQQLLAMLDHYEVQLQDFFAHLPSRGQKQESNWREVVSWLDSSQSIDRTKANRAINLIKDSDAELDSFQRALWLLDSPSGKGLSLAHFVKARLRDWTTAEKKLSKNSNG